MSLVCLSHFVVKNLNGSSKEGLKASRELDLFP